MYVDPILPPLAGLALAILLVGQLLRRMHQPFVVVYLLVGVVLGHQGLGLFPDATTVTHLGSLGVVLLLFFVGMEVSLPRLIAGWRIAIVGTGCQILVSVGCAFGLGVWLSWSPAKSVLMGFIISLSSTAVVLKVLREWGEDTSRVGANVTGVLLTQDLAIIPMLIILGLISGREIEPLEVTLQVVGGGAILGLLCWVVRRGSVRLPFAPFLRGDHEMQVYAAMTLCFGLAFITALLGLSTALGAFVAGILIGAAKETDWVHRSLAPFQVVFVGLFFISIGMLLDIHYVWEHRSKILVLVILVMVLNTAINAGVFRVLGERWPESLYGGALLAQIGEFSFVLSSVGLQLGIIQEMGYQTTVAVITISLFVSPAWISLIKRWTPDRRHPPAAMAEPTP